VSDSRPTISLQLVDLRRTYAREELSEANAGGNPLALFERWLAAAVEAKLEEPHAMTLATASPSGAPSARVVLLRGLDERGLVFFTNYDSRKGGELAANPRVALVFFWAELERQVRIEGTAAKIEAPESDAYFARRPRGHRVSAWASPQSAVVTDRSALDKQFRVYADRYPADVPRPPHWGGYRVAPYAFEFWQGREERMHDRLRYLRRNAGGWLVERLAP
jgi:pyridoxamine 5'-phosphate oxidase